MTTPDEALEAIGARFGSHPRRRALHAKGVLCSGSFTAAPEAAALTRAGHMAGEPVRATVRFSNGSGDPTVPDFAPDVRGLAVAFHLADGSRTDILAQTLPVFPFRDVDGFLAAMAISKRSLGTLLRLPGFAIRYPGAIARIPETNRVMGRRASFAVRRYYPFHAYRWTDAEGGARYVRYRWLPTVDEPDFSKQEAMRRGADYLFEELAERLGRGPVRMQLEVRIAGPGDDPDDPSSSWAEDCERLIAGTLEVTATDPDADDGIVFDPMRLVDGIEPSADPVLRFRPSVYDRSHARRSG